VTRPDAPSRALVTLALVALAAGAAPRALADDDIPTPFDHLPSNVAGSLTGNSLYWFGGAVAVTATMSASGGDHTARVFVQEHLASDAFGDTALYAGYIVPATVPPAIWIVGALTHDRETAGAGAASLQALATTVVLVSALKAATGRPYPLNGGDPNAPDRLQHPDYAETWKPFSLDGRLAWPSGHTAATLSIAAALTAYYPGRWWIPAVGYPLALAIGAGMISRDYHWTSDVLAGALIAQAVGFSIGCSFRLRQEGKMSRFFLVPMSGAAGLAVVGEL
jgi:membrane-associated phospholipid phosphatase